MEFNTISVIGLGYIGLPTAAVIASRRKQVIGVDVSEHAVDTINRGEIHIVEPELDIIVHAAVEQGLLRRRRPPSQRMHFSLLYLRLSRQTLNIPAMSRTSLI